MINKPVTLKSEQGLTLVELLISIAIISLIAGVSVQLVAGSLDSWKENSGKGELLSEARIAMERMVSGVRATVWVQMPLMISDPADPGYPASSYYPRNILAITDYGDDDGDGLSNEDTGVDINGDGLDGLKGFDDNNDGIVDNGAGKADDDEDGVYDEDDIDGIDDDSDGRIDEDPGHAFYTPKGGPSDDDGDGQFNEDAFQTVIYYLSGTDLMERHTDYMSVISDQVMIENVAEFRVLRRRVNGNTLIDIYLRLDNGVESVELTTSALARYMFTP